MMERQISILPYFLPACKFCRMSLSGKTSQCKTRENPLQLAKLTNRNKAPKLCMALMGQSKIETGVTLIGFIFSATKFLRLGGNFCH